MLYDVYCLQKGESKLSNRVQEVAIYIFWRLQIDFLIIFWYFLAMRYRNNRVIASATQRPSKSKVLTLTSLINVGLRIFFLRKYSRPYAVIPDPTFIFFWKKIIENLGENQQFLRLIL